MEVRAYHRGNHIFIEVEDDGRGIDYDGVRRRVIESGAMSPLAAAELSERELRELLFRPGFTTASSMTELAGRGVGLDVVRANVHALNGEIEVRSEPGRGACFTVKVPLTLIISQALFVRCGSAVFALPLAVIEEIRRLKPAEIEDVGGSCLLYTSLRAFQIRQLPPETLNASEEGLRAFLQRQLKKQEKTPADRDKIDLLLVQYFALCAPEDLYRKDIGLDDVAQVLRPVLGEADVASLEWCAPLDQILGKIAQCQSLRDMMEHGLLEQGRLLKESAGPLFYDCLLYTSRCV